jgi:hypothetical protein
MFTNPVKQTPKTLILVKFTARLSVSPVNPEAKSLTITRVNNNTKITIIAANKNNALLKLLVYLSAFGFPCSLRTRLYMGTKPVAIPALMKEKMTVGMV